MQRVDLTFELEASINLTPSELFAEVKARSSLLLPSIDDMEVEQNGGGSGNPGWKYIYLKGLGFHVCGYWHNCSEHYSEVGCKTIGGHSRATARRERWAVSASWYVPIISTNSTYYRYGTCSHVC